jgi:predicted enzyme related to lactoylglutathione lyase
VAAGFYSDMFGWETDEFAPGISLFRLPGYVGGEPAQPVPRDVIAVMAKDDGPARWSVDFWVPDADELAARVPELGGSVVVAPFDSIPTRQAVVADPFGAVFSVTTAPAH